MLPDGECLCFRHCCFVRRNGLQRWPMPHQHRQTIGQTVRWLLSQAKLGRSWTPRPRLALLPFMVTKTTPKARTGKEDHCIGVKYWPSSQTAKTAVGMIFEALGADLKGDCVQVACRNYHQNLQENSKHLQQDQETASGKFSPVHYRCPSLQPSLWQSNTANRGPFSIS